MEGIKAIRTRAGLSQAEVAERMGVPQGHVSRWETGRHKPTRENLERIADALGVSLWQLVLAEELVERHKAVEEAVTDFALTG